VADPILQSRTEAVQPSLWDRLVDDLPGIIADTDRRRVDLVSRFGAGLVDAVLTEGARAIERDDALDEAARRDLHAFAGQMVQRRFLEQRGIVVNAAVLREAVRRDIEALFNVERFESQLQISDLERRSFEDPADLIAEFPQVRRSVLNFGVPSFSGRSARDFDLDALAKELREVIAVFEPRFKRETIRVKVSHGDRTGLRIEVDGTLMLSPVPERLRLSTTIDLDNGRAATSLEE